MNHDTGAYILAGGSSSRMGADKGLLLLNSKPLVQYVIDALAPVFPAIYLVSSNEEYRRFQLPLLRDNFKGLGPAAGFDTALQHGMHKRVFLCSCDMPFIEAAPVQHLLDLAQGYEIALPLEDDKIEPMFTVMQSTCAGKWRELLLNGTRKLQDFFPHFHTNFADAALFTIASPRVFVNVNTPAELEQASIWMKK